MLVKLVGSTEKIIDPHIAKRWVQNHARKCYSEKNWDELLDESFQSGLVKSLITRGHHSPFDHFTLNFEIDGLPKALAMVLNNQGVYTTSEKSARYTQMSNISPHQRKLYDKWLSWFQEETKKRCPAESYPKLYEKKNEADKTPAEKLAQENARYMTSVVTPTTMTHTISWRQMNIIYHQFQDFIEENKGSPSLFKGNLASSMIEFVSSSDIEKWVITEAEVRMKGRLPLRFFRKGQAEEHFGEDVFSYNELGSFAYVGQSQRHRLDNHTFYGGFEKGAENGLFVPPLVLEAGARNEWLRDLETVVAYDIPQAQLLNINHRGMRENVVAKTYERECGLAQLEIARRHNEFLRRYAEHVPELKAQIGPSCKTSGQGCNKGGCLFGCDNYLDRLI